MGRRYYCDFCDKSLPPGLNHRKSHNRGSQHINQKRAYYLQWKEPMEILGEERTKRICHKWNQTGSCPFGENCKYSHRSNYELIQLVVQQNRRSQVNFDVQRWIEKKVSNETILPESLIA